MANDNSTIRGRPDTFEAATEDARADRRKRLAQRIGRLLAHTWLARRREAVTNATQKDEPPPGDHAT